MEVTQWENERANRRGVKKVTDKRFPAFVNEQNMFMYYPMQFVAALRNTFNDMEIIEVDYTSQEKTFLHETLGLIALYDNKRIWTEFEVITGDDEHLMLFYVSKETNKTIDPQVLARIREESEFFFENHGNSRFDIALHSYRKEYNDN